MEKYSCNTSEIIRHDFTRFTRRASAIKTRPEKDAVSSEDKIKESLDQHRAERANDNGMGSYATYKCPIF